VKRLAFALVLVCATATAPRAEAPQPFMLMRALQELQTQIVSGKARARDEQPRMLADIGRQFTTAAPDAWSDPRNARAAIVWLLSGGSPRSMRTILRAGSFPREEFNLARGALAFAEGRGQQAREILLPIDVRKLEPVLGSQVALVQAALVLPESLDRSIELLGLARLLAPGSLVEETALRRQISLVGQTSDAETFANLSRQYARRFKQSLYAEEFRASFAATFMRIGIRAPEDQIGKLEPILDTFDSDERCRLAVLIARASLLEAAWRSAEAFAENVMRPPIDKSCDVPRARLYRAAARAMRPDGDADLLALEKLDPTRLSAEDQILRRGAIHYATIARSWPEPRRPDDVSEINGVAETALASAEQALQSTAEVLKDNRR
jgi:chemotaxis protein MotC